MRIGDLATAVGVTTRTVRHYHHLGLLPEPERRAKGYRDYTLRHAVGPARIRRLTEPGLGPALLRGPIHRVGRPLRAARLARGPWVRCPRPAGKRHLAHAARSGTCAARQRYLGWGAGVQVCDTAWNE